MKIGILSDLHGNFEATKNVLEIARKKNVKKLFILGDIVGYYFEPEKILRELEKWDCHIIKGNHELMFENYDINSNLDLPFKYAKQNLSKKQKKFLKDLPKELNLRIKTVDFYLCHSTPYHNDEYIYPNSKQKQIEQFFKKNCKIILYGHTHYQFVHKVNKKILINPGSVGQPRDKKKGACWAIVNTENLKIDLRRDYYNEEEFKKKCYEYDPNIKTLKYFI